MPSNQRSSLGVQLRPRVTCPHCWHVFPPDEILWVSAHPDLLGDSRLGHQAHQRFLPTRFAVDGRALDVKGEVCNNLACPRCHLSVPREFLEMDSLFVSIIGAPGSGKSYYLASMTWQIRKALFKYFSLGFSDADPTANQLLSDYREQLFLNPDESKPTTLPKTEMEGDLYQRVRFGDRDIWYPRPFVFSIQPTDNNPNKDKLDRLSKALCVYDNAGEHFLPGAERANQPGTRHLSLSQALLFLFDPTQHPTFRRACKSVSDDPQLDKFGASSLQDQVLMEAANRIRENARLAPNEKYSRPLIVVVTKYDTWRKLIKAPRLKTEHVVRMSSSGMAALDMDKLRQLSNQVRAVLLEYADEMVAATEGFFSDVIYIPVSALGRRPEVVGDEGITGLAIRPKDIDPMWTEIPMLYVLNRVSQAMVRAGTRKKQNASDSSPSSIKFPEAQVRETG